MIRRMVTQLIIARLIPVAINAGKKAFSKKKRAPEQSVEQNVNLGDGSDTQQD